MDERLYQTLKYVAVGLGLLWLSWSIYEAFIVDQNKSLLAMEAGNKFFMDGEYQDALNEFQDLFNAEPDNLHALRGVARSLMQLGRGEEALAAYSQAINADPEYAAAYANRGVLNDRLGEYEAAIADYERAVALDPELDEGPHWLTRFLRNQHEEQATIGKRAAYLRQQLSLPPDERLLRNPEDDARQRPYNQ